MSLKYTTVTQSIRRLIFLMCVATIVDKVDKNLKQNKHKNPNQFMILTHLWPWNKVNVFKPGMNCNTQAKFEKHCPQKS